MRAGLAGVTLRRGVGICRDGGWCDGVMEEAGWGKGTQGKGTSAHRRWDYFCVKSLNHSNQCRWRIKSWWGIEYFYEYEEHILGVAFIALLQKLVCHSCYSAPIMLQYMEGCNSALLTLLRQQPRVIRPAPFQTSSWWFVKAMNTQLIWLSLQGWLNFWVIRKTAVIADRDFSEKSVSP